MNSISISILVASLIVSGAIFYSGKKSIPVGSPQDTVIADDLLVRPSKITKELVHSVVTDPANHDRLKNINGCDVNPQKPLWIRATQDEKMVVVAYQVTTSVGSLEEVWLSFEQDEFGRWKADQAKPPIYINK